MRKHEPTGEGNHDMKISPKFNNNMLGNGSSHNHQRVAERVNHNGGSIFDQQDEMLHQQVGIKNKIKVNGGGVIDSADVLVENEMLRSELQKMKDKMA